MVPHLEQVYIPTFLSVKPRSPLAGSTITVKNLEGEVQALRTEKAVLEEKAAKFSEETFEVESQGSEGLQV